MSFRHQILKHANPLKPSGYYMYHQFNSHKFYVLPTQCTNVFCVVVTINSHYFPIQYSPTILSNVSTLLSVRYELISIHNGTGTSPSIPVFPLSMSFHQISTIIFTLQVLLSEGQAGEVWEPSKQCSFGYWGENWRENTYFYIVLVFNAPERVVSMVTVVQSPKHPQRKSTFVPVNAMKAYRARRGIAPFILKIDTRWR